MKRTLAELLVSEQWQRAVRDQLENGHRTDLLALPLDSFVGEKCRALVQRIEEIKVMQVEFDSLQAFHNLAVDAMAVWLFG